jgi:hypothetical protein
MLRRARSTLEASTERDAELRSSIAWSARRLHESETMLLDSGMIANELRAAVETYARVLRSEGELPERMLVVLKETVHEVMTPEMHDHVARALIDRLVYWGVVAYFAA